MKRLTVQQYLQRQDAYPVTPRTIRSYIDAGILPGEKIKTGRKTTYYVHVETENHADLLNAMTQG